MIIRSIWFLDILTEIRILSFLLELYPQDIESDVQSSPFMLTFTVFYILQTKHKVTKVDNL